VTTPVSPLERIAQERERTEVRLARLRTDHAGFVEASLNSNADDEHDPEGATIAFERSQVATLARQLAHQLAELDAAQQRVEDGTYGGCERCGAPIPEGRLEARPAARTCVACAR
jgi:DnaK suppressor protein